MSAGNDKPVRRRHGWVRRVLIWLLLPVLATVLFVWYQRDLPRRMVERELAARLGARVSVGGLEVRGTRRFELRDLRVREMGSLPWLDSLRIERVEVEGGIGEIRDGRIALLRLSGVDVRLTPPAREPAAEPPSAGVRIGRLLLADGRLRVEAGERAEFTIEADLREVGSGAEGMLRVLSSGFPVAPLLALNGLSDRVGPVGLTGFEATAELGAAGTELSVEASSASTRIGGAGAEIDLPGAGLRATAVRDESTGVVRIDARPTLPAVAASSSWFEIDSASGTLLRGEARLSDVALARLLPLLPSSLPTRGLSIDGSADLTVRVADPDLISYELEAGIDHVETRNGELRLIARRTALRLEGSVAPRDGYRGEAALRASTDRARVSGPDLDLTSGDLTIEGTGGTEGATAPLDLNVRLRAGTLGGAVGGRELPHGLAPLDLDVRGKLAQLRSPRFEGRLHLGGPIVGELRAAGSIERADPAVRAALDWVWTGARAERLWGWIAGPDPIVSLDGELSGLGRLEGELTRPGIGGTIRAENLSAALSRPPDAALRAGRAAADFNWRPDRAELLLRSVELDGLLHADRLEPVRVRLEGTGAISPRQGLARLDRASLELDELSRVRLAATWDPESEPPLQARAGLEPTDIAALRPRLNALAGDPLPGYSLAGTLTSDLSLGWRPDGAWNCSGELRIAGPSIGSEDGARVLQSGDVEFSVAAESAGIGSGAALDLSAPLEGPLLLWGTVFGDWSERGARIDLRFELPPEEGARVGKPRWMARTLLGLDDGPRLQASLAAAGEGAIDYDLRAEIGDLAPVFERWVRAPLRDSLTVLEGMEAGGQVTVKARGRLSPAARTSEGRLELRNASMKTGGGGVSVRRLFVDLPWSLRWESDGNGKLRQAETEPLEGSLAFGRLSFGDVRFEETSSSLIVEGDSVGLRRELSMPFLDGLLVLERPKLVGSLRPGRLVESGIRISGVSLGSLTRALDIVPLDGTVDGRFPRVRLSATALRVEGDGEFSLLGGRVVVREISGEEVLSRFPKIRFSAEFDDIDLQQLTHTFDFGEMRGTLQGWIRDCELFRWVPVRFRARLETVERKGVPQTLNVKAINNIAILGTGGRVGVFDRGIHKFLDRYNYSRLGVEMALAQDSFLLRGLERRGERELFLKGRLPFRIDVVNAQPGKAVSFRTMLDRLSTLDFSTSTSAPPGEGLH